MSRGSLLLFTGGKGSFGPENLTGVFHALAADAWLKKV